MAAGNANLTPWDDSGAAINAANQLQTKEGRRELGMQLRNSLVEWALPTSAHWLASGVGRAYGPERAAKLAAGVKGATQVVKVAKGGKAALADAAETAQGTARGAVSSAADTVRSRAADAASTAQRAQQQAQQQAQQGADNAAASVPKPPTIRQSNPLQDEEELRPRPRVPVTAMVEEE